MAGVSAAVVVGTGGRSGADSRGAAERLRIAEIRDSSVHGTTAAIRGTGTTLLGSLRDFPSGWQPRPGDLVVADTSRNEFFPLVYSLETADQLIYMVEASPHGASREIARLEL